MKKPAGLVPLPMLLVALITSCGGGGGGDDSQLTPSPPPAASAEGVYSGTLTGALYSDFSLLVLENGEFWSLYGNDTGSMFYVYGFLQGQGHSSNGSFTASNVKDFYDPSMPSTGSVSATYDSTAGTISGTASSSSGSVHFSGGPFPNSLYVYDRPASLNEISGAWSMLESDGSSVAVNITTAGAVTTNEGGCQGSGNISPRPSGKNVFKVSLTFGGLPCALPGQTVTGVALDYPLDTGQTQFIVGLVNASRTAGATAFGIR